MAEQDWLSMYGDTPGMFGADGMVTPADQKQAMLMGLLGLSSGLLSKSGPGGSISEGMGAGFQMGAQNYSGTMNNAATARLRAAAMSAKANQDRSKFGNTPIWGRDAQGNPVLIQLSSSGSAQQVALPDGVTPDRGQIKTVDIGDKVAVLDANGNLLGYRHKGLAPERKLDNGVVSTLPAIPGGSPTEAAPGQPSIPQRPTAEDVPLSNRQQQEKDTRDAANTSGQALTADKMLAATQGIKRELVSATLPATGSGSGFVGMASGTSAGKVRSYVDTLKSGNVMGAMQRMKAQSSTGATGFGALNESELQLLIDDLGALNPDKTDPEIFLQTINRIEGQWGRVINDIRKNVSAERLRELGLHGMVSSPGGGSGGSAAGGPKVIRFDRDGNQIQ